MKIKIEIITKIIIIVVTRITVSLLQPYGSRLSNNNVAFAALWFPLLKTYGSRL
jgi:hypothetical protein